MDSIFRCMAKSLMKRELFKAKIVREHVLKMYGIKEGLKMKYRERPITIEAVRLQSGDIMPAWFTEKIKENIIVVKEDGTFEINTEEGILKGEAGDYIVLDINDKVYPCKAEIFERAYERVVGRSERPGRVSI